jgi:FHA domain
LLRIRDWNAVVTADRAYYDSVAAADGPDVTTLDFPAYCPERRFQLTGTEMRIGRRSVSRGLEPEIDLSGPPADPGVSHLHAVLIAEPDGGWSVLGPGSSNGTQVNGDDIPGGVKVPLPNGDRIHVGAWTLLTILAG